MGEVHVLPRNRAEADVLTQAQIDEYNRLGALVVPNVLTAEEVETLRRITDGFVDRSRALTGHDDIYDLEDTHTPQMPRVRRINAPYLHMLLPTRDWWVAPTPRGDASNARPA